MSETKNTVGVTLHVPIGRESCAAWLLAQPPQVVATCLSCSEAVHSALTGMGDESEGGGVGVGKACHELKESHRREMDRLTDELTREFEAQRSASVRSETAVLSAQLSGAKREKERLMAEVQDAGSVAEERLSAQREKFEAELEAQRIRLEEAEEEVRTHRAERCTLRDRLREETDARLSEARSVHEANVRHVREIYDTQLAAKEAALSEAKSRTEASEERARAQSEGQHARLEQLLSSLGGSNQRRGAMGEALVQQVHDGLNLGRYVRNAHQKTSGFGDGTWTWTPPHSSSSSSSSSLSCLVEVKLSHSADSASDVDKFAKDMDSGVRTGRVNAGLYLSLLSRIGGKPTVDLQILHGVPVMWASRASEDDLTASALVAVAFTAFAAVWPLCRSAAASGEDDSRAEEALLMRQIVVLLNDNLEELTKLEPRITFLERTGDQMRREAGLLRKTRDAMVSQITNVQVCHPVLLQLSSSSEDLPDGSRVSSLEEDTLSAVRDFHGRRGGHYPKHADDLKSDLSPESVRALKQRPELFQRCTQRVRAEKQQKSKRRRTDASVVAVVEAEEGGGEGGEEAVVEKGEEE